MNFGLGVGDHLAVATTLCSEVRDTHEPIVIEHASAEPGYCMHPTPKMYGLESYIAVPIMRPSGEYFGNVCALDSEPAKLRDGKTLAMMQLFAELVSLQLTAEEESSRDRQALTAERETAELREQFIAVLGHDLRSPLQTVLAGTSFLMRTASEPQQRTMLERIHSSGERMSRLIDDIMDFARGRLGGGVPLARSPVAIVDVARDVVAEVSAAHPDRVLRLHASDGEPASLDRGRIAQMLANLVANAVEHGAVDQPIDVHVARAGDRITCAVTSRGRQIPADVRPRLFQPFFRGGESRPRTGLGLGLYIAAEIARAHGGSIEATSSADGVTTFTVELSAR
jgi:hypothetical protein